jgi:hypothetical protein
VTQHVSGPRLIRVNRLECWSALAAQGRQRAAKTLRGLSHYLLVTCEPLQNVPVAIIDRRAIANVLSKAYDASGAVTSNRLRASVSAFCSWCMRGGLVDANVVIGTGRSVETSRER